MEFTSTTWSSKIIKRLIPIVLGQTHQDVNKTMLNFLKRYWLIFFLAGVVVVLFLIKTYFAPGPLPTPPPLERLPTPRFTSESITNRTINYQFALSLPTNFPQSLPVYKISQIETKTFPELKPDLSGPQLLSSDSAAIEVAKTFLQEKNISEEFASLNRVTYRKVGKLETFIATTSAEADIFVVDFWAGVEGTTVVSGRPISPLVSVWLGKNGKIQKAFATTFSLTESKTYPLRPLITAQQDLLLQKSTLVWLEKEEAYGPLPPETINNLTIEWVSLAYFLPSPTFGFLEPIYIFEGKAILTTGKTVGAAVYLPAIEETYLTP